MKTKTYDMKKHAKYRIIIGIIFFISGILFQLLGIFEKALGTLSFASWLTTVGLILIIFGVKNQFYGKTLKIDERYQGIINKASTTTFMFLIYGCLTLFIVGMIKPIKVDLALFSSWILFATLITYKISLWYHNKKN